MGAAPPNVPPRVSAIVPNYNHAGYLAQRIESIVQQTRPPDEILYLDDASTDESDEVVKRYAELPQFSIHRNESNTGNPFKQWNKGVDLATGDYVWIAEADDYANPCLVERLAALLDGNPSVGIAYCQSHAVDGAGQFIRSLKTHTDHLDPDRWATDYVAAGREECIRYLSVQNTIPNASAVLFRKSVFLEAGGAVEDLELTGDWLTWVNMLMISDVAFVAEPLNFFRHHTSSVRAKTGASGLRYREGYAILRHIRDGLHPTAAELEEAHMRVARLWLPRVLHTQNRVSFAAARTIYGEARQSDGRITRRAAALWANELKQIVRRRLRKLRGRSA